MPETKSTGGHGAKKPASAAKTATVAQTGAEAKPTFRASRQPVLRWSSAAST
jgi:hypothetical protein